MATCHISISRVSPGLYELRVKTPGSLGRGRRLTRTLPPDFSDFIAQAPPDRPNRKWRRPPTGSENEDVLFWAGNLETLKEIGGRLYESLFLADPAEAQEDGEDFTTALLTARGMTADKSGVGVEIDLSEAPELSRIPWEALYLAPQDLLLGIDSRTNVVRRLEFNSPLPQPIQPPIRMLVAVANPDSALEAGTEIGDIERRLVNLLREDETSYEIAKLPHATRIALQDRIETWKPHIIHFIGHGGFDEQGLIYLHSETNPGARDAIDSATLRDLVSESPPWLVVLNSCLSGAAAKADPFAGAAQNLIRANVPFVVAMQTSISDDAAIRFSRRFYAALASGEPVATAVTRGRNGIRTLEDESLQAELITPVLYTSGKAEQLAVLEQPVQAARLPIWKAIWADVRQSGIAQFIIALASIGVTVWLAFAFSTADAPQSAAPANQSAAAIEQYSANAMADDQALYEAGNSAAVLDMEEGRADYYDSADIDRRRAEGQADAVFEERRRAPEVALSRSRVRAYALEPPVIRRLEAPSLGILRERRAFSDMGREYVVGRNFEPNPYYDDRTETMRARYRRGGFLQGSSSDYAPFESRAAAAIPRYWRAEESPVTDGPLAATFGWRSASPDRIDIEDYSRILLSAAGARMAVELVGRSNPDEAPAEDDRLGLARAGVVADRFRAAGVPAEGMATASAAGRWAQPAVPGYRPAWERRADARLGLRDANRILFASGNAELPNEAGPMLDRLAAFARNNPGFLFQLEAHSERSEPNPQVIDRDRAQAVRAGLLSRGVDDGRIAMLVYSFTHPEVSGTPLAGADRRVQIVLIPIAAPIPRAADDEPAEEP